MDHNLRLTLAQTTLAKKLGLSRQWVGELVHRQAGALPGRAVGVADNV